jgi:nitrogen regulatory protein P-II 1
MKKIEVWIKLFQLDRVKTALRAAGVRGLTTTKVHRRRGRGGAVARYRGVDYRIEFASKLKLEVVVHDDLVEKFVTTLMRLLRDGPSDDEEILVTEIDDAVCVRTAEIAEAAIG